MSLTNKNIYALAMIMLLSALFLTGCDKKPEAAGSESKPSSDTAMMEKDKGDMMKDEGGAPTAEELFSAFADEDYRVDVKALSGESQFSEMFVEFDAPDTTRVTISSPQGKVITIATAEKTYMSLNGGANWLTSSGAEAEHEAPEFTKEDLEALTKNPDISYKGVKSCATGKCHVYEGNMDGQEVRIAIDKAKKRPVQVIGSANGESVQMDYTYEEITIELPDVSDAMNLPTPNAEGKMDPEDLQKFMEQFGTPPQ